MELKLIRDDFSWKRTTGELLLDGTFQAFTLELPNKDGLPGSCVPQGTYHVTIQHSPRFGRDMLHLQDIPNRSSILIHYGNTVEDTEGCILVGAVREQDGLLSSQLAFHALWDKVEESARNGQLTIEIIGGATVQPAQLNLQGDT